MSDRARYRVYTAARARDPSHVLRVTAKDGRCHHVFVADAAPQSPAAQARLSPELPLEEAIIEALRRAALSPLT